ncbi:MAG: DNA cytosine methyltransferase [Alphaproteobacteria bacterium]
MDSRSLSVLSLCAGVGGLDLGIRMAQPNARTVCFVEIEAFACEILATRMEDKTMDEAPIWTDLRTFDGKPWRGLVDCITAGYPCQPFSVAGKQKGKDDPRHLWPDVFRVVQEISPRLCFFENVPGHLRLGFEQVHDDLSSLGYCVKAGLFSAAEVGASHKRERLFILAYRESDRADGWLSHLQEIQRTIGCGHAIEPSGSSEAYVANSEGVLGEWPVQKGNRGKQPQMPSGSFDCELGNTEHIGSSAATLTRSDEETDGAERPESRKNASQQSERANQLANADSVGTEIPPEGKFATKQGFNVDSYQIAPFPPGSNGDWDEIPTSLKPAICRMADGLANRVDRIRACGNGVVPLAAAYAWATLTTTRNGE